VPGRAELAGLVTYLAGALARAGGELRLGVDADAELVLRERPDAVVLATGARPGVPALPGILEAPAVDAFEVLRRPVAGLRRALVLGGGVLGVGVAHVLAERGVEVHVVEPGEELAGELGLRPRWRYVADLRARPNVTVHLRATVEALSGDGAVVRAEGSQTELTKLDVVVPTRPLVPVAALGEALAARGDGPPLFQVGDCVLPRTAFEAMQEGAALGHRL